MALLRRLSAATAATTIALVVVGGIVRATGSGDACPQWPGCFPGRVLPPLEVHAIVEFSHRFVALVLSILIVATARVPRGNRGGDDPTVTPGFRRTVWWTVGLTGVLLLVGAYVRGEGAGLVFLDWPLMDGEFVPDLAGDGTVAAFAHRVLAAIAVGLGAVLVARTRKVTHRGVRALAWTALGLLVVQAGLGGAGLLTPPAPPSLAGHVAGSSLAWAALVALAATAHQ